MIYLKDDNVYFKIKKNMSSSTVSAITEQGGWQVLEDKKIYKHPHLLDGKWKFAILREPIDRFVSGYITVCKSNKPWEDMDWKTEEVMLKFLKELKGRGRAINGHPKCLNYHVAVQWSFLPCKIDYYAIQERIEVDWLKIEQRTGLPLPEPENVRDKETKEAIYNLLTPRILKIIKKIYKKDFKLYGKYATGK